MIFLDTNVVSELLRPRPDPAVAAWSKAVPFDGICTASVVEAELRAGVERLPDGRRKRGLGRDLDLYLGSTFGDRVYPFDRAAAHGHRLDIAAGTAVRFEPGIQRTVTLVPLAGARVVPGLTAEGGLA